MKDRTDIIDHALEQLRNDPLPDMRFASLRHELHIMKHHIRTVARRRVAAMAALAATTTLGAGAVAATETGQTAAEALECFVVRLTVTCGTSLLRSHSPGDTEEPAPAGKASPGFSTFVTASTMRLTSSLQPAPDPDVNGDGVVDGGDIALALAEYGRTDGGRADANRDGVVDADDVRLIADAFTER